MNNIASKLVCAVSVLVLLNACAAGDGQTREFFVENDAELVLGKISEADGPVEFIVHYPNRSSQEMIALKDMVHCSCATLSYDNVPVSPGAYHTIKVQYDPAYRSGPQMEYFVIEYSNGEIAQVVFTVEVEAMMHPIEEDHPYDYGEGLHLSHKTLPFGNRMAGETRQMFFRYGNATGERMNLSFEPEGPYSANVKIGDRTLEAYERDTVHISFTMPEGFKSLDTLLIPVLVTVNGKPLKNRLTVKAVAK